MLIFNLMSIQFMADNDIINWTTKTINIKHNFKLIHITIKHYPEYTYKSTSSKLNSKKNLDTLYNWTKVIEYWNKNIIEYTKAFNIDFNKLIYGVDYSLAPMYINNNFMFIGIFIVNINIIRTIIYKQIKPLSYSFLSRIEPYKYKKEIISNKYNFFYGILINNNNNNINNKEFILDTTTTLKVKVKVKYILQNSMNYLPKLEINRIKRSSQNLLNP